MHTQQHTHPTTTYTTQDGATLYALWPDGACERMGLQGKLNTSLTDMIGAVVNASNPAPVAAAINARLANLSSSLVAPAAAAAGVGGNGEAEMSQRVSVPEWYSVYRAQ